MLAVDIMYSVPPEEEEEPLEFPGSQGDAAVRENLCGTGAGGSLPETVLL